MSHAHPQKEKTKKIIQELETLQESRELAQEAKEELLEHNSVLKLHADPLEEQVAAAPVKKVKPTIYIKQKEDMERLARNTFIAQDPKMAKPKAPQNVKAAETPSQLEQMITFQFETMNIIMKSWFDMMNSFIINRTNIVTNKNSDA